MKNKKLWAVVAIMLMVLGALLIWQPWNTNTPASDTVNEPLAETAAETAAPSENGEIDSSAEIGEIIPEPTPEFVDPADFEDATEEAEGDEQGGL